MLRLETMILMGYDMPVLAIRQQLAAAIDVVVHLERLRDNSRRVVEISEIDGIVDGEICLHPLFRFVENTDERELNRQTVCGELVRTGHIKHKQKLIQSGLWKEEADGKENGI